MVLDPWKTLKSRYIVDDEWLTLRADRCETAEGVIIDPFYVLEKNDWAHVVAFDSKDRILIVRQYRHGSATVCAEIPAGIVDNSDASPLEAAKRELLEETGCAAERYQEVKKTFANPARQNNFVHCFLAYDAKKVCEPCFDETENIESEFVGLDELFALIDSGEFSQAIHISSVFMALRKRNLLKI
ncbi:MAG: NUDIX hydrolase [Proteobacteria bacterium]|nr:NUDIX hydrolase [Pseudomonadota bacterium]